MFRLCALALASSAALFSPQPAWAQPCTPEWADTFPSGDVDGRVDALTVFDNGSGPALYAGGVIRTAGGLPVNHIARWNGHAWSPLGDGMSGPVHALAVFDDGSGSGPALYAGGEFTFAGGVSANCVAKWDGSAWSAMGSGMGGTYPDVYTLTVFDDGSGPALYAGGWFTTAGGLSARNIARWDGSAWSPLSGDVLNGSVKALAVFDAGSGPALYAGGGFTNAGGGKYIAKWNGSRWSPVGWGMNGGVDALTVFDDGSGPALYAGGGFTLAASGVNANRIARWDGSAWSALGSGMGGGSAPYVLALTVFDDGSGSGAALYAGGQFTTAGSVGANHIAKWDGNAWSALADGLNNDVLALAVFDDGSGSGPELYAGGEFAFAGGVRVNQISKWSKSDWWPLGSGMNSSVYALTVFDDGSGAGPRLYAGGLFTTAGGVRANHIARWDGSEWSALGSGTSGGYSPYVYALTAFDDGSDSGPALYAGGGFTTAGGKSVNRIARWDGSAWWPLGQGMDYAVFALVVFDDGGGPALYAGGYFGTAGSASANRIAKWDGANWSALGSGMAGGVITSVDALTIFDDGSGFGPALYAGGDFTSAGGVSASHIARWDGGAWSALGSGTNGPVCALAVFDDGSGSALCVGGDFTTAGGASASYIARWDGTAWSPLGSGMNRCVRALALFDDGSGSGQALHAAGDFSIAGGVSANHIARWDGSAWSPLGSGIGRIGGSVGPVVGALAVFDDGWGSGPALYVGGQFLTAGGLSSGYIARWGCPPVKLCPGDMNCDGVINFDDIDPFVEAFSYPGGAGWPYACPWLNGDCNGDKDVTFDDIDPFVALLGTKCP